MRCTSNVFMYRKYGFLEMHLVVVTVVWARDQRNNSLRKKVDFIFIRSFLLVRNCCEWMNYKKWKCNWEKVILVEPTHPTVLPIIHLLTSIENVLLDYVHICTACTSYHILEIHFKTIDLVRHSRGQHHTIVDYKGLHVIVWSRYWCALIAPSIYIWQLNVTRRKGCSENVRLEPYHKITLCRL